ncbi:MAG: NUDIX hydrolase [Candidatus Parcubacteria bacterium]|nr:NUDIX hydrolase [Candidatus Parcubacteria bacterium]
MQYVIMASSAIFNEEGKMLILKRGEYEQFLSGYWTGIGGKMEDTDKSVEEAMRRETKEETGLDVVNCAPIFIEEFTREDRPGMMAVNIIYLCETDPKAEVKISDEHCGSQWVSREELSKISPITDLAKGNLERIFDLYIKIKNGKYI